MLLFRLFVVFVEIVLIILYIYAVTVKFEWLRFCVDVVVVGGQWVAGSDS